MDVYFRVIAANPWTFLLFITVTYLFKVKKFNNFSLDLFNSVKISWYMVCFVWYKEYSQIWTTDRQTEKTRQYQNTVKSLNTFTSLNKHINTFNKLQSTHT